jgi:cobalt-zinc-cadmium efflux system outer membrane protein
MRVIQRELCQPCLLALGLFPALLGAQQTATTYTWPQLLEKFEVSNPTLKAGKLNIDESKAAEITANLRPNPDLSLTVDGLQVSRNMGIWRPLGGLVETPGISYLHEREHKRELRRDQAKASTSVAESGYLDQERTLIFNLRNAFVQGLLAKAVLQNATDNLSYWDRELELNRTRYKAGDISQVDLNRLELQRVQFESDFETALVNLRTAKIQLLTLMNDRTPIERFDVTGTFDFKEDLQPLEDFRKMAMDSRPDLKEAVRNVELARVTHRLAIANGSTDPTFSAWFSNNPSFANSFANETVGGSISFPLRIFDRNQGEKARTQVDIGRNEKLRDAAEAQVLNDVDSAYYTVVQNVNLLKPYKSRYMPMATDVRDKMSFSYRQGGASLLDYLEAEKAYRDSRLAYLNLIGSWLTAANQMNLAVGREVM